MHILLTFTFQKFLCTITLKYCQFHNMHFNSKRMYSLDYRAILTFQRLLKLSLVRSSPLFHIVINTKHYSATAE